MIEHYLRPAYQHALVNPVARQLKSHCSANFITLLSLITGVAAAYAIAVQHVASGLSLLLLSGYLDTLDGTLARLQGKSSAIGTIYDIMADRTVEIAMVIALYWIAPEERALLALGMLGSILLCVTSFLVAGIFVAKEGEKSFNYTPGLMERPEAFIMFISMILLPAWFMPLAVAFIGLVLLTTIIRLKETVHVLAQ